MATFDEEFEQYATLFRELLHLQRDAIAAGDSPKAMELDRQIAEHIAEGDMTNKLARQMNEAAKRAFGKPFDEMD